MQASTLVPNHIDVAIAKHIRADVAVVVPSTCANIILCLDQQFCHSPRAEISWQGKMLHTVPTQIFGLSWPGTLVPIRRNQQPSLLADPRQKRFVLRANVRSHVLLVNAIPNAGPIQDLLNFGTIKVLVQPESRIMLPA